MLELVLFGLLASVMVLFFVNHLFFGGKLLKREKTGYLIDFVKWGTILLVLIISARYVFNY
jgi:hypothetical protein